MAYIASFKRKELKYRLTANQYERLREIIDDRYMTVDKYGLTTICNIYYDTVNYQLIRTSIEKPKYKEKLRLRSYGVPSENTKVFLEIKKKFDGIVYKRRISRSLATMTDYLEKGIHPENEGQILNEIDYFIKHYNVFPRLFLAYDRIAMYGTDDPEFRMTFDTNIRSRTDNLSLAYGDEGELLFDDGTVIMEIKTARSIPMWLAKAMTELKIYPTSFSKYGTIYKKMLEGDKINVREYI